MATAIQQTFPEIPPPDRDSIPPLLRDIDRWVVWRAGPIKPNGKFDKVPRCPATGRNINGQDPKNWLTFEAALAAYDQGKGDGIGIVLNAEHTINVNGVDHYLVALDFDKCAASMQELNELWMRLGKPYLEVSPSGNGLRMFVLSTELLKGGNDGNGHEMYYGGRFMTVTGHNARGQIREATAALVDLDLQWFGIKKTTERCDIGSNLLPPPPLETEENIERVKEQLSFVSSDTDYETWRNVVWSILSTGWTCAEEIARAWSMTAAGRYEAGAFDNLMSSFDPNRGISLGTLYHHAEQNGWTRPAHSQMLHVAAPGAVSIKGLMDKLLTADEVKALPNLPYRVRGLLPAEGVAAIYGDPGSGKSFLALDLCFAIAAGHSTWFDMKVKPAPVIYIALEGRGGIRKRIKAWEVHHKANAPKQVRFMLSDFTLLEKEHAETLAREIIASVGKDAVVVVDTLNQSAPGADENSPADMGKILGHAKYLAEKVQGLVILIHHSGKDSARGLRGHSSMNGAMDAVIKVGSSADGRSWSVTKAKDDEDGVHGGFELVSYVVEQDQDGLDVTSCAVRRAINIPTPKARPLSGKHQNAAMGKLRQVLSGVSKGIAHNEAIKEVAAVLNCPEGRKATVAKETIDRLLVNGHLYLNEGSIALA